MCDTKRCYVCNEDKSKDDFYSYTRSKTQKINYHSQCKKCFIRIKGEKIKGNPVLIIIEHQKRRIRRICRYKKIKKTLNFNEILGTDKEGFKNHLESLFYGGITWENYSNKQMWEVDHIIGLKNIQTFEDLIRLCHYTNTQPLLIEDHKNKSKDDLNKTPIV